MKNVTLSVVLSGITLSTPISAQVYHEPKDISSFDLSLVNLDADRIQKLSTELYQLALRPHKKTDSIALRTNAQLLYLAKELTFKSNKIDNLNQLYKQQQQPSSYHYQTSKIANKVLLTAHYLATENNKEAIKLSMMIQDTLLSIIPNNSLLLDHQLDKARWESIIPPIKAYQKVTKKRAEKSQPSQSPKTIFRLNRSNAQSQISESKHLEFVHQYGKKSFKITRYGFAEFNNRETIERNQAFTTHLDIHLKEKQHGSIIGRMNKQQNHRGWDIWVDHGKLCFELNHNYPQNSLKVVTKNPIPINTWSKLSITYDGSSKANGVKIYVNGNPVETDTHIDTLTDTILSDAKLRLANRSNNYHGINHLLIAKLDIVKGAQTKEQIRQYNLGKKITSITTNYNAKKSKSKMIGSMKLPDGKPTLHRKNTIIFSPLIQQTENFEGRKMTKSVLTKIHFKVQNNYDSQGLDFELHPNNEDIWRLNPSKKWIRKVLKNTLGSVSQNKILIDFELPYSKQNQQSISGPLAISTLASYLDRKIMPNTIICGQINFQGAFYRPSQLWQQLPALISSDKPHRIIIGKEAENDFRQLIGMKKTKFFILNEVLKADSLIVATEFATKANTDKEKASDEFAKLQQLIDPNSIERMSHDPEIKAKLRDILKINPDHISAKMILLWSSDKRPDSLDREYTARSLKLIFDQYKHLKNINRENIFEEYLTQLVGKISKQLVSLKPHLSRKDEDLYDHLLEATKLIKSLARAKHKNRNKDYEIRIKSGESQYKKLKINIIKTDQILSKILTPNKLKKRNTNINN